MRNKNYYENIEKISKHQDINRNTCKIRSQHFDSVRKMTDIKYVEKRKLYSYEQKDYFGLKLSFPKNHIFFSFITQEHVLFFFTFRKIF